MIIDKLMYKKKTTENLKKQYLSWGIFHIESILIYFILFLVCIIIAASFNDIDLIVILLGGMLLILIENSVLYVLNEFRVIQINQNDIEEKLDKLLKGDKE